MNQYINPYSFKYLYMYFFNKKIINKINNKIMTIQQLHIHRINDKNEQNMYTNMYKNRY